MPHWKDIVVSPDAPLEEAISRIDASGIQVALVLSADGRLEGMLTDGDIRRAILRGQNLRTPTKEVMNPKPTAVLALTPREEMLALMRRQVFHHLPLIDESGRVVGLATLDEFIGAVERPNWVVLMAGGLGTRLHPLTEDCPKPLLSVGGKPILETILQSFAEQGFKHIFLSVNYKAEMIRNYFGTGEKWGVQVHYLHEGSRLGTAGALSLLPQAPTTPLIVMNGDLLTRANFDGLLKFHAEHGAAATMAVREYDFQVPYGVVNLDKHRITSIEEKPVHRFFVNAGIYVLSPDVLGRLPAKSFFDMPTLFEQLIGARETTVAYPLREYWLDVGRLEEYERAQREWSGGDND
ncbi:nucleotidyltransferase family protein [Sulfuricaulis limicola]|uniref:nucleotidyltransferase family protein n=1 Tax=Sulfuricaulis limicola TaxID=1620215 RepID=UPI000BBA7A5B